MKKYYDIFLCLCFLLSFLILFPTTAQSYIGPGLGVGTVGVVLGILGALVLMLLAIIWYPLKRFFKKICNTENMSTKDSDEISPD